MYNVNKFIQWYEREKTKIGVTTGSDEFFSLKTLALAKHFFKKS
jgi:hypothetical protein